MKPTTLTLKTIAWIGDGAVKVALLHVHEQSEPITLKCGEAQQKLIQSQLKEPMHEGL